MKIFSFLVLLSVGANSHAVSSVRLKLSGEFRKNKFEDTLVAPAGKWITKKEKGSLTLKIRTTVQGEAVMVETEMSAPGETPVQPSVITRWGGPATVSAQDKVGKKLYQLTVTPIKE